MPGRTPWERLSGDDVESVLAMLLLRQHPHGHRIRPTQGDNGVDVLVPKPDNHWDVYQIKRYTTTLTGGHKTKITKSWTRLRDYVKQNNITLDAWYVVRPIDPTLPDGAWLANLTKDAACRAEWIGLTAVDNWSADYPQVVDYFLDGGSRHVIATAEKLLRAAGLTRDSGEARIVEPTEALDTLGALAGSLNAIDPHYKYQLTAYPASADGEFQVPPRVPGSVFTQAIMSDGTVAQMDIIPWYDEAPHDRPLPLNLHVNLQPDSDEDRRRVADFIAYGIPFDRVPVQMVSVDLPDGLDATDLQTAAISVIRDERTVKQRLDLLVHDGDSITGAMPLLLNPLTRGIDGLDRAAWVGDDLSGVIGVTIRIDPNDLKANISLTCRDISGANPAAAAQSLSAVLAMRQGSEPALHVPGGPVVLPLGTLPRDFTADETLHDYTSRLEICSALVVVQTVIPRELTVPDMSTVDNDQVQQWVDAAVLLRGGEITGTWGALSFVRSDLDHDLTLPSWIRVTEPLTVNILGQTWTVGYLHRIGQAATWTPTDDHVGRGILSPGSDATMRIRLAPEPDAAAQHEHRTVAFAPITD